LRSSESYEEGEPVAEIEATAEVVNFDTFAEVEAVERETVNLGHAHENKSINISR
jgi:hypothetical protein